MSLTYPSAVALSLLTLSCPSSAVLAESFVLNSGEVLAPLDRFRECDECPEMIAVPLGEFEIGVHFDVDGMRIDAIPTESGRLNNVVEIDIPFAMSRNEVTYAEWYQCVDAGACGYTPDQTIPTPRGPFYPDDNYPVVGVSFEDIQEYASWLNDIVGENVYRLPTEAEWEYSALSGASTPFAQGNDLNRDQANFYGKYDSGEFLIPAPVEDFESDNQWGLRHMAGNVIEITRTCWTESNHDLPTSSAYLDLDPAGAPCRVVTKGGGYNSGMYWLRPAHRGSVRKVSRNQYLGFRILRSLERKEIANE